MIGRTKILHAYTDPMQMCTATAPTGINHRLMGAAPEAALCSGEELTFGPGLELIGGRIVSQTGHGLCYSLAAGTYTSSVRK
jgi:hypothetical protein